MYQPTSDWLSQQLWEILPSMSVREALRQGQGLNSAFVIRMRALGSVDIGAGQLPLRLPIEPGLGSRLAGLATARDVQPDLSAEDARLQVADACEEVRNAMLGYVAAEFVRPRIMGATRSLDVLCCADDLIPSAVLVKMGLARAFVEEREQADRPGDVNEDAWSTIVHTWERDMAYAKATVKRWADLVVQRRYEDAAETGSVITF